jgi:sulfite exporter TauE/SafE
VSVGLLVSAWLVGALGGAHGLAMCGGFVGAIGARDAQVARPLLPARVVALRQAGYHVGRIATYALLGAAFGAAGATILHGIDVPVLQRTLYAAANVRRLALGLSLVVRVPVAAPLQRAGAAAFVPLLRAAQPLLRRPGALGRVTLGLTWGMMPCALVYGVLPLALLAGGAWQGALVMLAFGAGTVPHLLAAGLVLSRAQRLLSARTVRAIAAAAMIAFALLGIWRALALPGVLAQGPFCIVP